MTDWERLCHYVMGLLQGAVEPPNPAAPMQEAWTEYERLGGHPQADPWPVADISDSPRPDDEGGSGPDVAVRAE